MATTMNKVQKFTAIAKALESANITIDGFDVQEFLAHEVDLLNKKAASPKKPSKTKVENDGFKADILAYLATADAPKTIKELQAAVPSIANLSNQRITHMLTDLCKDDPENGITAKVTKSYVKKVPYFAIA